MKSGPNNFSSQHILERQICLQICRQLPDFLNNSIWVYSIKLKNVMPDDKNNAFRKTSF